MNGLEDWNDDICKNISDAARFPLEILDRDVQKNAIRRFFNFYLGGKIPKGLKVTDLVFAVIAIIPLHVLTEDLAFSEVEYEDGASLFKLPEDDIQLADKTVRAIYNLSLCEEEEEDENEIINNIVDFSKEAVCANINITSKSTTKSEIYKENDVENIAVLEGEKTSKANVLELHENFQQMLNKTDEKENMHYDKKNDNIKEDKDPYSTEVEKDLIDEINTICKVDEKLEHYDTKQTNTVMSYEQSHKSNESEGLKEEEVSNYFLKEKKLTPSKIEPFQIPTKNRMGWFGYKKAPLEIICQQYGPAENAAFIPFCNNLLDMWDTNVEARVVLKYLFGVIALTMMRAVAKSFKHVASTFSSTKFLEHIKYINKFTSYSFQFSVPHKNCIQSCYRKFSKREGKTIIMFAKIVMCSMEVDKQIPDRWDAMDEIDVNDPLTFNIFKATVLSHASNYGLELVTMVQIIADRLRESSVNTTIEVTHCEDTAESWKRLDIYIQKYLKVYGERGTTHYWARVIDEEYFKDLSCTNNYPLAIILAVFNAEITGSEGIWQSKWVQMADKRMLEEYKELGKKMYKEFLSKDEFAKHHIREVLRKDKH